jgi:hypothetical protein
VLSKLGEPIRESPEVEASLPDLIQSVKAHGLEVLVAKRRDSRYDSRQHTRPSRAVAHPPSGLACRRKGTVRVNVTLDKVASS